MIACYISRFTTELVRIFNIWESLCYFTNTTNNIGARFRAEDIGIVKAKSELKLYTSKTTPIEVCLEHVIMAKPFRGTEQYQPYKLNKNTCFAFLFRDRNIPRKVYSVLQAAIALLWMLVVAVELALVYGWSGSIDESQYSDYPNQNLMAFYEAVRRPLWGFGLMWVTVACTSGYGGISSQYVCFG